MVKTAKGKNEAKKQKYTKLITYVKLKNSNHYSVKETIMTEEQAKKRLTK